MNNVLENFEQQVLNRSKQVPVLVDFWAPWCAPCRTLGPVLERLASEANGRWELVKINTEENQELAAVFEISSIPAVKLFVDGQVTDSFVGALPEREIRRFLDRALPSPAAARIQEAEAILRTGDRAKAASLLEQVLAEDPGNQQARLLLAEALLHSTPEKIRPLLGPIQPDSDLAEKAAALRVLARVAQLSGHTAVLPESRVRESYLRGAAALRAGDFAAALESFIAVVEKDRNYDEGGAKEACKAIFQFLGRTHPVSERFLRPFSSALHV